MPIQFPGQVNHLNAAAITDTIQNQEYNALRNDAVALGNKQAQASFDENNRQAVSQFLSTLGKRGQQAISQDPNAYASMLPEIQKEFQRLGLPTDKIPPAGTSPQQLMQDFAELQRVGDMMIPEQPITKGDLVPVAGEDGAVYSTAQDALGQGVPQGAGGAPPAQLQLMEKLTDHLPEAEKEQAFEVFLGLKPRAGSTSSQERIAGNPNLTTSVAQSQAEIRQAGKFAEATGASRAKMIDGGFEKIQQIDGNIRNLDKAIAAIDEGASTGAIESRWFPSFRESTLKLEQVQKELGLDVIGAVTFGALSKGELDLALDTALPTGLQPDELKESLVNKKAAQEKLRMYYQEQIDFLDQGGTPAGFLRSKQRDAGSQAAPDQDIESALNQAREAIQAGRDPAAVSKMLQELGIDPGLL